MRRVSDIAANRASPRESSVSFSIRTPEAGKALNSSAGVLYWAAFLSVSTVLTALAWHGAFGTTTHGFIILTLTIALVHWAIHSGLTQWQDHHRTTSGQVTVRFERDALTLTAADGTVSRLPTTADIRFSSRPHWLGKREERDERRVQHPIGYDYRDAWEVWCEAGLDVVLVASVSQEEDARAIVRHLTEEYLFVTRSADAGDFAPSQTEPA